MQANTQEANQHWQSVSGWALIGLALAVLYVAWQHFATREQWVFLLDNANLALHEAGHPLFGLLHSGLMVYGGTLMQLLFPSVFAVHFYRQRHSLGFAISGVWLGENLLNIGRYMADARAQQLPLVGGGDHDWTFIFSQWGMLAADTRIAGFTRLVGACLMLGAVYWLWRRWRAQG
ncbi:hypothetical protein [Atopomonas hussainii]|uniref:hypothetical protein n=1 Tax=Atopomonas hussainii TaxID=1429083 RepID=UPI0009002332|nr:hypothetical protein [Atopomonas hussainii]